MKKIIISVFTVGLALGCSRAGSVKHIQQVPQVQQLPVKVPAKNQTDVKTISIDSLIGLYIHHSNNEMVNAALKDNSVNEEAVFDQEIKTDTANYLVYNIGHDYKNDGGPVFASDSWIYVDSLKRKIFEYRQEGKLIEWKP